MGSVKVSVIIPAYNVEAYIDEAIQSILAQRGASFELLIGDDASTDGTWARIENYRADPRVRAWRFRRHQGAASVRNRLISYARGSYLSICDADDVMLSENLLRLSQVLDRNPKMGVAFGGISRMDKEGHIWPDPQSFPGPSRSWDLLRNVVSHPGAMLRRVVVERSGGYWPQLPLLEDYDLFLRLAEMTQFYRLDGRALTLYRRHSGALSERFQREGQRTARNILRRAILRRYGIQVPWVRRVS